MLGRATAEAARWRLAGPVAGRAPVPLRAIGTSASNVSARQFPRSGFVDVVR
ncbi:hypothetical protein [Kitasatospora albolonga]|uniref:hypothetical protein n=1 Tax=Kitasatospora albolonga TaxID=68173 RepID=UPI0031E8CD4A